jgi:hypothetical protein
MDKSFVFCLDLNFLFFLSPSEAEAHLGDGEGAMLIWKMEL